MKLTLRNWRRAWTFNSTPEGRLILAVASVRAESMNVNDLAETTFDWLEVLERAIACDLAPLLYHRLRHLPGVCRAPQAVMERLKGIYQWHAARNLNLYTKLHEVRESFKREEIPLILLKGAVLADLIYGNVALRPMRDVDILVRRCDLDRVDKLLQQIGYARNETYQTYQWFRQFHHNIPYASADQTLTLELHHHIVPPRAPVTIPAEDLWEDACAVAITNEKALVLSPEKFIVHLCVHLAYDDRFCRALRALTDIAATIAFYNKSIDWTKFLSLVHAYGASRSAHYALWIASRLVDAEVPVAVLERLAAARGSSRLNDILLKSILQRSISSSANECSVVPAWMVKNICGEFLESAKTWQAVAALMTRFPPQHAVRKFFKAVGRKS